MLNKHSKIPGGNIGIFIAIQDGEYEIKHIEQDEILTGLEALLYHVFDWVIQLAVGHRYLDRDVNIGAIILFRNTTGSRTEPFSLNRVTFYARMEIQKTSAAKGER